MVFFSKFVKEYEGKTIGFNDYSLQIYEGGKAGNIFRKNGTILCKFYITEMHYSFCFSKPEIPYEFGYDKYSISLDSDLDAIKIIYHKDSAELYSVLNLIKQL